MKKLVVHNSRNFKNPASLKSKTSGLQKPGNSKNYSPKTNGNEMSMELAQALLNNTRDGFLLVSTEGIIKIMNSQAEQELKWMTGQVVKTGMNFTAVLSDEKAREIKNNFLKALKGETINSELQLDTPAGSKWIRLCYSFLNETDGEDKGVVILICDTTIVHQNEEKIRKAEQKIMAMLSSTQEGCYIINPDYTISLVNEAGRRDMKRITGKNCEPGMSFTEFAITGNKRKFLELFQIVMDGNHFEEETCVETNEGESLWFYTNYFPVRDENGNTIAVSCISKDITERKIVDRALQRIREEREEYQFRLQSILDNTPLIVFIKDLNGKYLLVNRSFKEFLRLTDGQVVGKTDFDFEKPEVAQRFKEADEKVINTQKDSVLEESVEQPDGLHNLMIVKFPLFDRENKIYGIGGIASDITEKVQQQQKLIEAKKKAEDAEQLQEQFLANMSHEIRTPMNGIIGMTNILMNTHLTPEQDEFVQIIRQSSDNLLKLINDILDLSKIKAGKLAIEKIDFNLKETLDNSIAAFRIKAREKNIHLSVMCDQLLPEILNSDPHRLTQIMTNLLSNAFKFTEKGSIEISVKLIEKKQDEAVVCFAVTDTGIGIPANKLNHIFESFEQAAVETTRKYGGTGLGLSITKRLVNMLGGDIEVKSELHKGTTFSFVLKMPIGNWLPGENKIINKDKEVDKSLAGKTILIAEDNEVNQKVIMHILNKAGIQTLIVNNGKEAVTILEEGRKFDLIILDLQMPLMNGFQTTTYIRQKLKLDTPIIAMTASALRNERVKCFDLGMNEYLTKPFVPADLFNHLRKFLLAEPTVITGKIITRAKQNENELYNLSLLTEMDDNDYFCEVLQLFLDTTPAILEKIKEGKLHEDWETVYKEAHKLKSSLGILQMNSMLDLAVRIEGKAKDRQDTEKIKGELKLLSEQFALIKPMIEAELTTARQQIA